MLLICLALTMLADSALCLTLFLLLRSSVPILVVLLNYTLEKTFAQRAPSLVRFPFVIIALISVPLSLSILILLSSVRISLNMCLRPLHIRSRALHLSLDGGQPFYIDVPCGHCAECNKLASDSYYLRAYYHARTTIEHGGFVYFDTLTYRDADLPRMSSICPHLPKDLDFPRFDYQQTRLFFVRLRRLLARRGISSDAFSYFLSSEYGASPLHTHRPHYHVLFFVNAPIDPHDFSEMVSQCWPFGRTDGLPYQSRAYVDGHTFSLASGNFDLQKLSSISLYVAKYVAKDATFIREVNSRLSKVSFFLLSHYITITLPDGKTTMTKDNTSNVREYIKSLRRHCYPFHRQSKGFGISALLYNDLEEVMRTGMMSFPSSDTIVKHVPIPMYFKRKLFYDLTKDFRGMPKWEINERGEIWYLSRAYDSAYRLATRISDFVENSIDPRAVEFRSVLGSRSYFDFASYLLFYRGRIASKEGQNSVLYWHESNVTDIDEWLPMLYRHHSDSDYLLNTPNPVFNNPYYEKLKINSFADFKKVFIIDENSSPVFYDFDYLFDMYSDMLLPLNESKQEAYDFVDALKRRRKAFLAGVNPAIYNPLKK